MTTKLNQPRSLASASATPQNWQRTMEGMRARGTTLDALGETACVFEAKRRAFTIDCDRRDPRYYRVSLPCVDLASPPSRARKLRAANDANLRVKCAKVVLDDRAVSIVAEQFHQTPEEFLAILDRLVDCCLRAEEIYLKRRDDEDE